MHVVHESIYQALYLPQANGLAREMTGHLRTGRRGRLSHRRTTMRRSRFSGPLLSERPAEVDSRLVPGHWEGGFVCGAFNRSAMATLVERTSSMLLLVHLNGKHDAATVRECVGQARSVLPSHLRKFLTLDQGSEMAEYLQFQEETTIPVYFCDPHSPWQRGSNENTNRLIRQYFPEGTNLNLHGPERRPRLPRRSTCDLENRATGNQPKPTSIGSRKRFTFDRVLRRWPETAPFGSLKGGSLEIYYKQRISPLFAACKSGPELKANDDLSS